VKGSYKLKPLREGDTIGVVALASPCEEMRLVSGLKFLESLGFKTKVVLEPARAYGKDTFLFASDTAQKRAKALKDLFLDKKVALVIAARGGYGSMEVLPLIDFKAISKTQKLLVGLSDITAVLVSIYSQSKLPAIHGATVESAFSKALENPEARKTVSQLVKFLSGTIQNPFVEVELKPLSKNSKPSEGRLIGGNLTLLSHLIGTPFEPDFSNHILFLEDIGEKPYRVHRMLLQMKLAGKFSKLKGVLLGSFKDCVNESGASLDAVFKDIFGELKIPVLGFAPFGHEIYNLPVPIGLNARIGAGKLEILDSLFS